MTARIADQVTSQWVYVYAVNATDYVSPVTGKVSGNWTVTWSKNGSTIATMSTTVTEVSSSSSPGVYKALINAGTTLGAFDSEELMVFLSASGVAPITKTIEVFRIKITAGRVLGVESDGDLTKVNLCAANTDMRGTDGVVLDGATATNLATVDGIVDSILADTNELQADWANGGRLDLILDSILADTNELQSDDIPGAIAALDVLVDSIIAEVVAARGEPSGVPAASATIGTKVDFLYMQFRNKKDGDGSFHKFYNDSGSVTHKQSTSESSGTVTTGKSEAP